VGTDVLAVDVGGTKLAAAVVDATGRIRHRGRAATPASADPEVVAAALCALVRMLPTAGVAAVGVGSAGPLDAVAGTVSPVNIPAWRGFGILGALARELPGVPSVLVGDAQCMALAEHRFGGHRDSRALLGMVVSTGVGGGLVVGGRLAPGVTGNAGHVGHVVVDLDGPPCPCGGRGCVEALASGPSLTRWALAHGWTPSATTLSGARPPAAAGAPAVGVAPAAATAAGAGVVVGADVAVGVDARVLAADAVAGDVVARRAFRRAGRAVAAGVVTAAALADLDDVVIGGGVAEAGPLLFEPLRAALAELAGMAFIRRVAVHRSRLGAAAGLLGAAAVALDLLAGAGDRDRARDTATA
jgi:glucokinase